MMSAVGVAVVGLIAFIVGLAIGFWFARQGQELETGRVAAAEAALTDYKAKVNEHFQTTAEHFKRIGEQYREMYEQVADSAQELMSEPEIEARGNPFLRIGLLPDAAAHAEALDEPAEAVAAAADENAASDTTDRAEGDDAEPSADDHGAASTATQSGQAPAPVEASDDSEASDTSAVDAATEDGKPEDVVSDDTAELPRLDPTKIAAEDTSDDAVRSAESDANASASDAAATESSAADDVGDDKLAHPAHNGATNGAAGAPTVSPR